MRRIKSYTQEEGEILLRYDLPDDFWKPLENNLFRDFESVLYLLIGDGRNSDSLICTNYSEEQNITYLCHLIESYYKDSITIDTSTLLPDFAYTFLEVLYGEINNDSILQVYFNLSSKVSLNTNLTSYYLQSNLPLVQEGFFGRDSYLQRISDIIDRHNHLVFLYGDPAIGKTELAKQYAKKFKSMFKTIIFAPYGSGSSLRELICNDSIFSIEGIQPKDKYEPIEDYYERKYTILKKICDEKTLIIIDNFDVKFDPFFADFALLPCYKIITTRNNHKEYKELELKVDPIDDLDELLRLFKYYYGEPIKESEKNDLLAIFNLLGFQTYAIELIARQMQESYISTKKMLDKLRRGIKHLPEEEFIEEDRQGSAYQHICAIYRISELNEDEKYILRCLSLMGIEGVSISLFKKWVGHATFNIINSLHNRGWIHVDEKGENSICSLHPLAIEVIHDNLKPDENNTEIFLKNISDYLYKTWERKYLENLAIEHNVKCIIDYFEYPDVKKLYLFDEIGSYLWQIGKFKEAISYEHMLYERCLEELGPNTVQSAYVAKSLAGCYFNSGREKESKQYYESALNQFINSKEKSYPDLALAYEKVARCYTWEEYRDFTRAEELFDTSKKIYIKTLKKIRAGEKVVRWSSHHKEFSENSIINCLGGNCMEMGRMYQAMEDYSTALKYSNRYYRLLTRHNKENLNGFSYAHYDIAYSLYYLSKKNTKDSNFEKAQEQIIAAKGHIDRAFTIINEWRGDRAVDAIDIEELYGDICCSLGKKEISLAKEMYSTALTTCLKLLGEDHVRTMKIRKKLEGMCG